MGKMGLNKKVLSSAGILTATLLWGLSFVVVKDSTENVPVVYLMALRYLIATLCMVCLFWRRLGKLTGEILRQGMVLGLLLFLSQLFQTAGCKYTTAGKNAFLSAAYVIFVPFLHWLADKKKPGAHCLCAAGFAVIGIGLLSLQGDLSMNRGDLLTLAAGLGLGVHILFIDRYTVKNDPILLALAQFFFANLFAWFGVILTGEPFPVQVLQADMVVKMLYLGVLSTMTAFLLQTVCQRHLEPNTAAVLLTTEAVFGMLFSVLLLGEAFTLRIFAGCVVLFLAVLLSQMDMRGSKKCS